jgi:hypothetical protein
LIFLSTLDVARSCLDFVFINKYMCEMCTLTFPERSIPSIEQNRADQQMLAYVQPGLLFSLSITSSSSTITRRPLPLQQLYCQQSPLPPILPLPPFPQSTPSNSQLASYSVPDPTRGHCTVWPLHSLPTCNVPKQGSKDIHVDDRANCEISRIEAVRRAVDPGGPTI